VHTRTLRITDTKLKKMLVHEVPIDDVKVGVWCAMSASRITGPIFP